MAQAIFYLSLFFLAAYAYYRLAKWLATRRGGRLRYWWPSSMVVLCASAVILDNLPGDLMKDEITGGAMMLSAFLGLPILPVLLLDGMLVDALNLSDWSTDVLTAASIWAGWYAIIRLIERRGGASAAVSA